MLNLFNTKFYLKKMPKFKNVHKTLSISYYLQSQLVNKPKALLI